MSIGFMGYLKEMSCGKYRLLDEFNKDLINEGDSIGIKMYGIQ